MQIWFSLLWNTNIHFPVDSPSSYLSSLQSLLKYNLTYNKVHTFQVIFKHIQPWTHCPRTDRNLESSLVPLFRQPPLAGPAAPWPLPLWKLFTSDKGFCKRTVKSWSWTDVRAPSKSLWENSGKSKETESALSKVITADPFVLCGCGCWLNLAHIHWEGGRLIAQSLIMHFFFKVYFCFNNP